MAAGKHQATTGRLSSAADGAEMFVLPVACARVTTTAAVLLWMWRRALFKYKIFINYYFFPNVL